MFAKGRSPIIEHSCPSYHGVIAGTLCAAWMNVITTQIYWHQLERGSRSTSGLASSARQQSRKVFTKQIDYMRPGLAVLLQSESFIRLSGHQLLPVHVHYMVSKPTCVSNAFLSWPRASKGGRKMPWPPGLWKLIFSYSVFSRNMFFS